MREVPPEVRFGEVDSLRGLSIIPVMLLHYVMLIGPYTPKFVPITFVTAIQQNAYYGVCVFFVISGFLIATNCLRRFRSLSAIKFRVFYRNRFARIVPPLVLLTVFLLGCAQLGLPDFQFHDSELVPTWKYAVGILSLRLNLFWAVPVLGFPWAILWTLSVEEMFYVMLPIVGRILKTKRRLLVALFVPIIIAPFYRAHLGLAATYDYLSCFDLIAMGVGVAMLVHERTVSPSKVLNRLSFLALLLYYLLQPIRDSFTFGPTIVGVLACVFILTGPRAGPGSSRQSWLSLPGRFLRKVGLFSYELYLFHIPLLIAFRNLLVLKFQDRLDWVGAVDLWFPIFFCLALPVCVGIAKYYSEPLKSLLRGSKRPKRSPELI